MVHVVHRWQLCVYYVQVDGVLRMLSMATVYLSALYLMMTQRQSKHVRQIHPFIDLYRPLGLQDVEAPGISRHSAYEGGKVVSLTHRPPSPLRRYHSYSFLLEA
jgi:hypothetical protein